MADPVTIDLRHVARGLGIPLQQVEAVVELLDDGNTVPFITRYRKDQSGGLDEEQVRQIQSRLAKMRLLAERKETILRSIAAQGKLTEKLTRQIQAATTTKRLEDLYLPFKPKKQTLSTTARSRGLELLATEILGGVIPGDRLDDRAADFIAPDRQVPTAADALLGAGHILAEQFSERADLRHRLREILQRTGKLVSTQAATEPKPSTDKTEKPTVAREGIALTPPNPLASSLQTTASLSSAARLVESPAVDWAVAETLPEESVISHHTVEAVPGDGAAPNEAARLTPDGAEENFDPPVSPLAEVVASTESLAEPSGDGALKLAIEVVDTGQPPAASSSEVQIAAATASSSPKAPAQRAAASRKLSKAEQLREKKEQKKKKLEERRQKAFRDYYSYSEEIRKIPPHRVLAINRGERARVLRVKLECDLAAMDQALDELCVPPNHPHADFLRGCARDALARLILPSLDRDVRRELTERAETHAVGVFARNLRNLFLASPVRDRRVLAVDPGYKSGCKLVALDEFGNVLGHNVISLIGKPERRDEARRIVVEMFQQHQLSVAAIGNGAACRHAEEFFSELIGDALKDKASYVIVNEAGASVYSTSRIGREELPQHDALARGAVSIGRRLQDPLSELVKIDPANLGVGLYQHDIKANHLRESLDEVVESCVNYVGVDVNTASPALLRYVSGLNQLTARRLYEYRLEHGPFRSREQLKEVPGIGEATFVQAAGFLKIVGGDNPLDATWIHPESYSIAARVMEKLGINPSDLVGVQSPGSLADRVAATDVAATAGELQVGALLLKDILAQLARPGRDPREDFPGPVFKRGVLKLEDLTPGMELNGTVLNVVDFGAFVDIGMHDSGLVHVSQLADKFVRDPHEVTSVGDIVRVWVLDVDKQRRRVSLTMIPPGHVRPGPHRHGKPSARPHSEGERPAQTPPRSEPPKRWEPASAERPPFRRPDRPRFADRPRDDRPPRPASRGPARPPKPRPITPITDEMKTGKEPMRSFGDLLQFYGIQPPSGSKDQGRSRKDSQRPGKDTSRRRDQGQAPRQQPGQPTADHPPSPPPEVSSDEPLAAEAAAPSEGATQAPAPPLPEPRSEAPPIHDDLAEPPADQLAAQRDADPSNAAPANMSPEAPADET